MGRVVAPGDDADSSLGVLFFSPFTWQRGGSGAWQRVSLAFDDASLARAAALPRRHAAPAASPAPPRGTAEPHDDFLPGGYATVVARALRTLADADLVSLTLSQSFRRRLGDRSPAQAFSRLRAVNPAPATFMVDSGDGSSVFGASPDLQLVVCGREVESFPVCGTVARGHGPVGEAEALRCLFDEEVDAASLAVCTDALRNDLAPLCEPGSLRLVERRRPMTLATVVHAVDRLRGRLREGVDAWDAIVATAAPVMVTGTPRGPALAAIAAHEAGPRGWYGGLVVEVRGNGDARVGTILRAASVRGGVAEVRTGGDLLAGSDPAREELETRVKAVSLWRAFGLAVDADLEARVAGGRGTQPTNDLALPRAVTLSAEGDPFAAALAETLLGLGLELDAAATPIVLAGGDDAIAESLAGRGGVVAIGDAAARVLRACGVAVATVAPQHGRLVSCLPVEGSPSAALRPFTAMRYATLALAGGGDDREQPGSSSRDGGAGWTPWLRDEAGAPLVLARTAPAAVCFLIRPESLLSDPLALDLLRAAIAFTAGRASYSKP
ncbi:MAG: chorismate-binding protein [Caldimonas sp.]